MASKPAPAVQAMQPGMQSANLCEGTVREHCRTTATLKPEFKEPMKPGEKSEQSEIRPPSPIPPKKGTNFIPISPITGILERMIQPVQEG